MKLKIKTRSKLEKIAATSFLYSLGYAYDSIEFASLIKDDTDLTADYGSYPCVLATKGDKGSIDFCCQDYDVDLELHWSSQFEKIKSFFLGEDTMKLTRDYNATVSNKGIQVGCQLITFAKFDELAELVEKNRP